jgi:hypothetical protein
MRDNPSIGISGHLSYLFPLVATLLGVLPGLLRAPGSLAWAAYGLSGLLWTVGLTLGILVLAAGRPESRRRAVLASIGGLVLCVFLIGYAAHGLFSRRHLLLGDLSRNKITIDSEYDSTRPVVDTDYQFELAWPGPGWKLLREQDARNLVQQAVAGAVGRGGTYGVVLIENAPTSEIEPLARQTLETMDLQQKKVDRFELVRFAGEPAARAIVSGSYKGLQLRYVVMILVHQGYTYQLTAWAPLDQVPADGATLRPFFESFKLRQGAIRPRVARAIQADITGAGWRIQGGVFESASFGFEVRPTGRWRLAVGKDLEAMNALAEVGLVHRAPDIYGVLLVERAPGLAREKFIEHLSRQVRGKLQPAGSVSAWPARVGGQEVVFQRFHTATHMEFVHGVVPRGDLYLQVLIWNVESLREKTGPAILEALTSIRFLDPDRLRSLHAALRESHRLQTSIGASFSLRQGVYRSFADGFSLRTAGPWRVHTGDKARSYNSSANVVLEDPTRGLTGMVIAEPTPAMAEEVFHQRALEIMFGHRAASSGAAPRPVSVGGLRALSSSAVSPRDGLIYRFTVTTVMSRQRAYQLIFWGFPAAVERGSEAIRSALAGFTFYDQELPAVSQVKRAYRDSRFGFQYIPAGEGWQIKDSLPAKLKAVSSQVTWTSGKRQALVLAIYNPGMAENGRWFTDYIEQILRDGYGYLIFGSPRRELSTLAGTPCRHLRWSGLKGKIHAYLVERSAVLYALILTDERGWGPDDVEAQKSGFSFID